MAFPSIFISIWRNLLNSSFFSGRYFTRSSLYIRNSFTQSRRRIRSDRTILYYIILYRIYNSLGAVLHAFNFIPAFHVMSEACGRDKARDTLARKSLSPGSRTGSRRGSRGSSGNASAVSTKSNKSPPNQPSNMTETVLENVTVEILEAKA